ncbi:(p)ppGpp synthase/HD superfamily hydrolase [Sulfitobacter undariae]|uniref:(P)ppGpp synthase/HD superfamily hydrolase n=1 Tax=Sulfitobacter undariae TaxID=1563671 RepID=A0A7W6H0H1_9RHOB|nr:HD domain-containing protein [Sulfitobacter undariae]MBB3993603.1 (p)ppGpp synthase/HD superfamily hydrolase [Sulfitobacter undariae]
MNARSNADALITRAAEFAEHAHQGQFRKGENPAPYITHPAEVAQIVRDFGGDHVSIAAAWLHDALEDTPTTFTDLEHIFGSDVAAVVLEVTDDTSLPQAQRRQAQIASAPQKSVTAALVKAADQMSNVRSLRLSPPDWTDTQVQAYLEKARKIVELLPCPPLLKQAFEQETGMTAAFWEAARPSA